MKSLRKHVNDKTYWILKNNIKYNNRDVVATIVYNELSDMLEYCKDDGRDVSMINTLLHRLKSQFYTDVPLKLKPYCVQCSNGYFKGIYDPYVLALLTADADPWVWEDNGIQFLEIQEDNKYITYSTERYKEDGNCKNKRAEDIIGGRKA